jgi:hypothetical protein
MSEATQPISNRATPKAPTISKCIKDSFIAKLSESIQKDLQVCCEKMQEEGDDSEAMQDQDPNHSPPVAVRVNQHYRFNLIRHRDSKPSTPTLKLFKSFTLALCSSDRFMLILPVNSDKQKLPALSNVTRINNTDANNLLVYFKPYFTKKTLFFKWIFPHIHIHASRRCISISSSVQMARNK